MLGCSLVLALALGFAQDPGELPRWNTAPPPPPEPPKQSQQLVPADGNGLITLGSISLATSGTLGLISVALTVDNDPHTRSARELALVGAGPLLGTGIVLLTLGLVVRRQFRNSPAGNIPDAPRTGNGMLLGGAGLIVGGSAFTAQAIVDIGSETCGSMGCYQPRPIGAPVQLGLAIGSIVVGTGLVVGGVKRRLGYREWAQQRMQLAPTVLAGPSSVVFGVAGRF